MKKDNSLRNAEDKNSKKNNGKKNIWIDCDPGIDDAIALAMAAASRDKLRICGISTVAGNQTSERVTKNALKLADFLGLNDVPVVRGAERPLIREAAGAGHVHGETGLGDYRLPETDKSLEAENGIYYMYETIMSLPEKEKITLVPTGPLTNIALLLRTFPEVKHKIQEIVLMGGAYKGGNVTPTAEFNIWADPEAAQIVFDEKLPTVMCGLDVTRQSGLNRTQIEELCINGSEIEKACGEMLKFYLEAAPEREGNLAGIHDAVTILYLTNQELFGGEYISVKVDCSLGSRRGTTMCRKEEQETINRRPDAPAPVFMLNQVNLSDFQEILLGKLKQLPVS